MKIHPLWTAFVALLVPDTSCSLLVSAFTANRQLNSLVRHKFGNKAVLGLAGFLSLNQFLPQPTAESRSNRSGVDLDLQNTTTAANETNTNATSKPKNVDRGLWKRRTLQFFSPRGETRTIRDQQQCWASLARMLLLLRWYESEFGLPPSSSDDEGRRNVIAGLTRELYESGAPTWVVEPLMERVAHGLIGPSILVQFCIFPRQALISYSSASSVSSERMDFLKLQPGFNMHRLDAAEQVAARLISLTSNEAGVTDERYHGIEPLIIDIVTCAERVETTRIQLRCGNVTAHTLAKEILDLASETDGLFDLLSTPTFQEAFLAKTISEFWKVSDSTRELFTKLAVDEALRSLTKLQANESRLSRPRASNLCRFLSSGGVSALWFGGSFPDMLVAGLLAVMAGLVVSNKSLSVEERIPTEVVACFTVGLAAGLLALKWPSVFCFGAMAVAALLDLFQGYKIVYAVNEILSKRLVTGTARLVESLLMSGLISYSIRLGLVAASWLIHGGSASVPRDVSPFLMPFNAIGKMWYPLVVPMAALGWSGLFRPSYEDVPMMVFHGTMAVLLSMVRIPSFIASMVITFSAGIACRVTRGGAMGSTLAGLYVFVPGVFIVRGVLSATPASFLQAVLSESVAVGLGSWCGTILCSPTKRWKQRIGSQGSLLVGKRKKLQKLIYF